MLSKLRYVRVMKRSKYTLLALGAVAIVSSTMFSSCIKENPDSPGFEYFPDMYRSPIPETNLMFVNEVSKDSLGNRLPAEGTIPRGWTPFPYANTPAGDSLASAFWKNPYGHGADIEEKGKFLYERNCMMCHGAKGDGNGKLVESGKYEAQPPSYLKLFTDGKLTDGHVYHVITYGKGNIGSHAVQLNPEERWYVIEYVQRLGRGDISWDDYQKKLAEKPAADTAKTAAPAQGAGTPN